MKRPQHRFRGISKFRPDPVIEIGDERKSWWQLILFLAGRTR